MPLDFFRPVTCITSLGMVLLLASCKEKILPDSIAIGATDGMEVYYHQTFLGSDLEDNDRSFWLDVDDDGVNDLQIRHRSFSSTYFGVTNDLRFIPLHSKMKLLAAESIDSVFFNSGTQTAISSSGDSMYIIANTYSCSKTNGSSFYATKTENRLTPKLKGDRLSVDDSFNSGTCVIIERDSSSYSPTGEYYGNAPVYILEKFKNSCAEFPKWNYRYIGFRLNDHKGDTFLGWIRVKLRYSAIEIDRHAIQVFP